MLDNFYLQRSGNPEHDNTMTFVAEPIASVTWRTDRTFAIPRSSRILLHRNVVTGVVHNPAKCPFSVVVCLKKVIAAKLAMIMTPKRIGGHISGTFELRNREAFAKAAPSYIHLFDLMRDVFAGLRVKNGCNL